MKYCQDKIDIICEAIKKLKGRVGACKEANICYDTFRDWYVNKPEFAEAIKRAEEEFEDNAETVAVQSIFRAMPSSWQAAAWWCERRKRDKYALMQKIEHSGELKVNFSAEDKGL